MKLEIKFDNQIIVFHGDNEILRIEGNITTIASDGAVTVQHEGGVIYLTMSDTWIEIERYNDSTRVVTEEGIVEFKNYCYVVFYMVGFKFQYRNDIFYIEEEKRG